eukprot:NODE_9080_length_1448_cov_6.135503.p1 GENE.NODE_9080_length_1448_cov_6.135503~~NODE_9080_length_1448_cov_6.135503.p1  ORF type:complete len:281 (+),score=79.18 NODE_9080_length_1448_cov_6.135503:86-928(+)
MADAAGLTVMTYNIHSGVGLDGAYDLPRLARLIQQANADVVFLQEVEHNAEHCTTRKWSCAHADDQARRLAELAGLGYAEFFPAMRCEFRNGRETHGEGRGLFGCAILSRFPPTERAAAELVCSPFKLATFSPRNVCALRLPLPWGDAFWAVCTHLSCDLFGTGQLHQARELMPWMQQLPNRAAAGERADAVLCGADLNSPRWFAAARLLHAEFEDLWYGHGVERGGTTGKGLRCLPPLLHVDYLLLQRDAGLTCDAAFIVRSSASDHDAVVARLRRSDV